MAFLAPTLLKSMDLQWGQRVENSPNLACIMTLCPHSPDFLWNAPPGLRTA